MPQQSPYTACYVRAICGICLVVLTVLFTERYCFLVIRPSDDGGDRRCSPRGLLLNLLRERVWLTFTRGDQLLQIAVYERAPCVRAATEAFIFVLRWRR